jgi:hypothetical protein
VKSSTTQALDGHSDRLIQVIPVTTAEQDACFLDVPNLVYANDPNWVAPFRSSLVKQLARDPSNPFLSYGNFQAFIAIAGSADPQSQTQLAVGRIVAAVNQRLIEREEAQIGLFGYFECIDDFAVAEALFTAACDWLREQGMTRVRGPIDLFTHNRCLFLVDGFDSPPTVLMPYNPPYYPQFVERAGWEKAKDAYAYNFPLTQALPDVFAKGHAIATKAGVTFRPIRTKGDDFIADAISIYQLTTQMFVNNYSSTPRSQEEFLEEAKGFQALIDPDVFPVAEDNGQMVGYWMGLPDYNIALKHINGKLDLWGTLKFFWYRRQIDQGRVILFASLPEYRSKRVPLALIYLGLQGGLKKGKPYKRAELGYVYEDNAPSRKLIEASGGTIEKTYRIYEKAL